MTGWIEIAKNLEKNPHDIVKEIIKEVKPTPNREPIVVSSNKISVIHVVGPNAKKNSDKDRNFSQYSRFTLNLQDAYNSVIDIFENIAPTPPNYKILRLLPISGGEFSFKIGSYDELKRVLSSHTNNILFKICNGYINAYNETNSGANVIIKDIKPLDTIDRDIPLPDVLNTILLGLYTAHCFIRSIFDLSNKNIEMCLYDKSASTELNELLLRVIFTEFINRGFLNEETQRLNKNKKFNEIAYNDSIITNHETNVTFKNESFIQPILTKNDPYRYIYCDPAGTMYIKNAVTGAGGASGALYTELIDPLKGVNDKFINKYPSLINKSNYVGYAVYQEYKLK